MVRFCSPMCAGVRGGWSPVGPCNSQRDVTLWDVPEGVKNENGGGSIYRSDGRWIAKITDVDGRRRRRTCRTQNEARRALRDLLAERDRKLAGETVATSLLSVAG